MISTLRKAIKLKIKDLQRLYASRARRDDGSIMAWDETWDMASKGNTDCILADHAADLIGELSVILRDNKR